MCSSCLCKEMDVRHYVGTPNAGVGVWEPFEAVAINEVNLSREMPFLQGRQR